MILNQTFELSMILDTDPFQKIFTAKASYLKEVGPDDEYLDTSLLKRASPSSIGTANTKRKSGY